MAALCACSPSPLSKLEMPAALLYPQHGTSTSALFTKRGATCHSGLHSLNQRQKLQSCRHASAQPQPAPCTPSWHAITAALAPAGAAPCAARRCAAAAAKRNSNSNSSNGAAASYDYDLLIIGCGVGGHGAALHAVERGMKTAVIEGHDVGGTCVNRGCVPSKALLAASGRVRELRNTMHLKSMGIQVRARP